MVNKIVASLFHATLSTITNVFGLVKECDGYYVSTYNLLDNNLYEGIAYRFSNYRDLDSNPGSAYCQGNIMTIW